MQYVSIAVLAQNLSIMHQKKEEKNLVTVYVVHGIIRKLRIYKLTPKNNNSINIVQQQYYTIIKSHTYSVTTVIKINAYIIHDQILFTIIC